MAGWLRLHMDIGDFAYINLSTEISDYNTLQINKKIQNQRATMKNVFPSPHPLVAHKLSILRRVNTDPRQFRELVREIAALLTYEATADLATKPITVQTRHG